MAARVLGNRADGRLLGYVLLGGMALAPVLLFALGPLRGESFGEADLRGPAGIALAFSAGVLSFVSPCVLPIVPVYLTHLSGASVEHGRIVNNTRITFTHALAFTGGLSLVFIILGSSAGLLGSYVVIDHQREFEQFAGLVLMVMGAILVPSYGRRSPLKSALLLVALALGFLLVAELADLRGDRVRLGALGLAFLFAWLKFSGYIQLNFLQRQLEIDTSRIRGVGYSRSAIIGGAWGLGWTPCIGPVLAAILTLAGTSGDALLGFYLLTAYSVGFSVPFLITALLLSDAQGFLRKITPFAPAIEVAAGVMLIGVGMLLFSGRLTNLNQYFEFLGFNEGL
ncbi:MAG: cytochrome c biogenesis CcdA family protein [Dehalococcoidia bacterium]